LVSKFLNGCGLSGYYVADVRRVQEGKADMLWLLNDLTVGAARLVAELEEAKASTGAPAVVASAEVEAIFTAREQYSAAENVHRTGSNRAPDRQQQRNGCGQWPQPSISSYAMTCPQTCNKSLRQVMQHWNVPRNSKSCCPLHQSVQIARMLLTQVANDPCEPLWSPHVGWQCGGDCNALNHEGALRCKVCNSSALWNDSDSASSFVSRVWSSDSDDEYLEPQGQAHAKAPEQEQQETEHQKNKVSL
jgi:hypothetical protein